MLRRTFLITLAAFLLNPFKRPAHGIIWLFRVVAAGARVLRTASVASRASRTFSTGVRYSRAVRPYAARAGATGAGAANSGRASASTRVPRPSGSSSARPASPYGASSRRTVHSGRYGSPRSLSSSERQQVRQRINATTRSFEDDIRHKDREQLKDNLWKLIDHVSNVMDIKDAIHFVEQWADNNEWSVIDTRVHIEDCPACKRAYMTLTRGTEIAMVPIVQAAGASDIHVGSRSRFGTEMDVYAGAAKIQPKRELDLPHIPASMRSALSGKDLTVLARIDEHGKVAVVSVDDTGFSRQIVSRARAVVEEADWIPGREPGGDNKSGLVRVIFRW